MWKKSTGYLEPYVKHFASQAFTELNSYPVIDLTMQRAQGN